MTYVRVERTKEARGAQKLVPGITEEERAAYGRYARASRDKRAGLRGPLTKEEKADGATYRKAWKRERPELYAKIVKTYMSPEHRKAKNKKKSEKKVTMAGRPRPPVCEVCSRPPQKNKVVSFDHCHVTKAFRGWLCDDCNVALGCVEDRPDILRALADYLENFKPAPDAPRFVEAGHSVYYSQRKSIQMQQERQSISVSVRGDKDVQR